MSFCIQRRRELEILRRDRGYSPSGLQSRGQAAEPKEAPRAARVTATCTRCDNYTKVVGDTSADFQL